VPLNLYRRHQACTQKRKHNSVTRRSEESPSKGYKQCGCYIYGSGTLKDGFSRRNTKQTTWPEAEAQANLWEKAGSWAVPAVPLVTTGEPVQKPDPLSAKLDNEIRAFFDKTTKRIPPLEPATLRQHKTFKKQFLEFFCDSKGYVTMRQLQPGDFDGFYEGWNVDIRARANKLGRLRKLRKFLLKRRTITPELADEIDDIKTPTGSSTGADRVPFSDDEMERLYKACDKLGTVTWTNQLGTHSYTGEDVKDFIILDTFTGFRISDVATFDTKRRFRKDNHIFLRMQKSKKELRTWVPDWVQERLNDRDRRFGPKIFKTGKSEKLETVTDTWRKRLQRVFDLAEADGNGTFETRPIPHRFRYTFVRILLERGVPVPLVAELAGDTEEVILKYYKQWVPELQEKLTKTLKEAFGDKPRLVAIKGGKSS
jgi:hypothetical protein